MNIFSSDYKRGVDIGTSDIWISLSSTISAQLGDKRSIIPLAVQFLENEFCLSVNAMETARQFNLIRDMLSQFSPDYLVYDSAHPEVPAPWAGKISPIVTSCANFYTTADGEDLLYEIVGILCYGGIVGCDVFIQ